MSAPNYSRPAFDPEVAKSLRKPMRGQRVIDREEAQAEALKVERREKAAARKRDGRCRWPEAHKCRGGLESAHIRDASLGGAMDRRNLVTLCAWLHRRGPVSIHGKHLRIEPNGPDGANGGLSFYQQGVDGAFYLVARETRPFEIERD